MMSAPDDFFSSLRILIIDDDDFQLEFLTEQLNQLGISAVSSADGGAAAIQQLVSAGAQADVIICDVHMPGIDGFELMKLLGDRDFGGAIILMSGQGSRVLYSASLVAQLARLNFLSTLAKPIELDVLRETLNLLNGSQRNSAQA